MPLFSIITPLFNKEDYFPATIHSVLSQTFQDWEWIIVDDGSTDGGLAMARDTTAADARVRVFSQSNAGPCSARNRGIIKAVGEWLLFLDADDLLDPDYLAQLAAVGLDSGTDIHAGGWKDMNPGTGEVVQIHWPPGRDQADPNPVLHDTAIAYAPWHPTAAIVRRKLIAGEFLWDETMNRLVTEDTVFWWRLIANHRVTLHSICGVRYRRGTPGCRDEFRNPTKWAQGMFHALQSNVAYWQGLQRELTSGQVASLVRVYSAFGYKAEAAGAGEIATKAFHHADTLLASGKWSGTGAWVRRLTGTRRFEHWREAVCR
jgi:glycosyltransferase involved in cell wall biosynthesis